ncbi:unnamed protein product [Parnassius apollo]|uniref:(apollo) hypothetical protein n=1 Tax=Parnassius apollo TaxID=110799 RepID=A0A8S3VZ71_PARAO|nr:unnamed protein product [Parnassius apollo]
MVLKSKKFEVTKMKITIKKIKYKPRSKRSGLNFPIGRAPKILHTGYYPRRIRRESLAYLRAALDCLTAESLNSKVAKAVRQW